MELAAPLTLSASKRGGRLKDPGYTTYHKRPVRKGVGLSQLCASAPHLAQAILCFPEKELNVLPVRHKRQPPSSR